MEANLIKIGNSKGFIIPSRLLKLIGLKERVNIDVENNKIIITPAKTAREGWEERIKNEVRKSGQPERLMPESFEEEEGNDEWTW